MPRDPFDEFFRRVRRMFKDLKFDERELPNFGGIEQPSRQPGVSGFRVEIKDRGTGKPEVKVERFGEHPPKSKMLIREVPPEKPEKPSEFRPIKRMLEPNVAKLEKPREVILTMQTPGVSERDVEIRQLGQTLEVIARKPSGEAYFAAFELPSNVDSGERSLNVKDGILVIKIPRRPYARV